MAKAEQRNEPNDGVQALAEQLYVRNWRAGPVIGSSNPTAFAAMCFDGAKVFLQVASRVREGQSTAEIISPPEAAPEAPPENVSTTL